MTSPSGFRFAATAPTGAADHALYVAVPAGIQGKAELFERLRQELRLPDYFGGNWDALDECLRDLSWLRPGQMIVLTHADLPFRHAAAERGQYLRLLLDATRHWQTSGDRALLVYFPLSSLAEVQRGLAPFE